MLCKPTAKAAGGGQGKGKQKIEKSKVVYGVGIVLMGLVFLVGLRNYRAFCGEEEYKAVNMKETERVFSLIGPRDMVIFNFDQVQAVAAYYLPESVERFLWRSDGEKLIQQITSPCGRIEDTGEIKDMLKDMEAEGRHIWFMGSFNSRDDIVAMWREEGLDVEEKGSFLLERYWFNLYRIS